MTKEEWPTWNHLAWGGIAATVFVAGGTVLASTKLGWDWVLIVPAASVAYVLANAVAAFRHKALPPFATFCFMLFVALMVGFKALTADDLFVRIFYGAFSAFMAWGCVLLAIGMRRHGWTRWGARDGRKAP